MKKQYRNLYDHKKPIPLLHIAKLAWFKFVLEKWDEEALPHNCFEPNSSLFSVVNDQFLNVSHQEKIFINVIGHSTCLIQMAGKTLLTDPVWSDVAGPFNMIGAKRRTQPSLTLEELPKIDLILLSHDHYDHLDKNALKFLMRRDQPKILTGKRVSRHLKRYENCVEMNWFDSFCDGDLKIHFTPAQHFSGRGVVFNKSLWGGFIVESLNRRLYFLGDTGFNEKMFDEIKEKFPEIDVGIIPIGAYKPYNSLKKYHLSPEDAVSVHRFLNIKASIAVHFGTYQLSIESVNSQIQDFLETWSRWKDQIAGDFILPQFGSGYVIDFSQAKK